MNSPLAESRCVGIIQQGKPSETQNRKTMKIQHQKELVEEEQIISSENTPENNLENSKETIPNTRDEPLTPSPPTGEKVGLGLVNYSTYTKEELINAFKDLMNKNIKTISFQQIKNNIEDIKINFYKKHKIEIEEKTKKFIEQGGKNEDFKLEQDKYEVEFKELYSNYKVIRLTYNKQIENEKQENLKQKNQIIEEIKNLINRKESLNKTFKDFRELQKHWKETGQVPLKNLNDIWETYHHHVEKFYDYIKINKELRDLDLKKNLKAKIELCEKTEELLSEPSIRKAFDVLQKYHSQWRETGPIHHEKKDEIWGRFKIITSKINKKHQEHIEKIIQEQVINLQAKTNICEKIDELTNLSIITHKQWEEKTKNITELQNKWRTIGFTPKKDNNKIYLRYKNACDTFFANKRHFYENYKEHQSDNLKLKTDLCIQAEALKDSNDWKKTTNEFIDLQERWKNIGSVPKKDSDDIWEKFKTACDTFFKNKGAYYSSIDDVQENNLHLKQELIEEIEKFEPVDNNDENIKKSKEFQKKWTEIGHVPYKIKDEIQNKFSNAINNYFDNFKKLDEFEISLLKFKNKLENVSGSPKFHNKLEFEQDKITQKLKQLESDIALWDNNIGFFTKSKNSEALINDINNKIDKGKKNIKLLKEKLKLINNFVK